MVVERLVQVKPGEYVTVVGEQELVEMHIRFIELHRDGVPRDKSEWSGCCC